MSWRFDNPCRKIINGEVVNYAKCDGVNDFSGTYLKKIIDDKMYYIPLYSNLGPMINAETRFRKIITNNFYYCHSNVCDVTVYYEMTSNSPTSGWWDYTWNVTEIFFEMPLPVATSGSIIVPANTKSKSGNLLNVTKSNSNTLNFSISATYNGVTVSGSTTLTTSGSKTFILS